MNSVFETQWQIRTSFWSFPKWCGVCSVISFVSDCGPTNQIIPALSHWSPEKVLNLRQDAACSDAVNGFVPSADDIRNKQMKILDVGRRITTQLWHGLLSLKYCAVTARCPALHPCPAASHQLWHRAGLGLSHFCATSLQGGLQTAVVFPVAQQEQVCAGH